MSSTITTREFNQRILTWFEQHGRKNLPWQLSKTPYKVWVSEIMLQQTQVATVIPYFQRFMERFPTLENLANGSLEEVLYLWTGLGYYSRARNLHKAAILIQQEFKGEFPKNLVDVMRLPGVGRSTAGAILSLACNQPIAILDGNVKRVLARFAGITGPIDSKKTVDQLWQFAENYMPHDCCAAYTQAMMDLGATLCTRSNPICHQCPLQTHCLAFKNNLTKIIPAKKTKAKLPSQISTFLIIKRDNDHVLLEKRDEIGIWGGLWSLPQIPGEPNNKELKKWCEQRFALQVSKPTPLPSFTHTFSHYHLKIHPIQVSAKQPLLKVMTGPRQIWYNLQKPNAIGLPQPVKQLLEGLANEIYPLSEARQTV